MCIGYPCFRTGLSYGVWLDECPATDLRLRASIGAQGLLRGDEGVVIVSPVAMWLEGEGPNAYVQEHGFSRGVEVELELRDDEEKPVDGLVVAGFERQRAELLSTVTLPEVPDGDYTLHATLTTGFETREVDLDLPLYAPALVHVMTDRPLYKPGQEVLLRSLLLKRTDRTPLDGRPGRWEILSPSGTKMLEERDRAGAYGIADSSFPLDQRAEIGTWTAVYRSGQESDRVSFEVKPFKLPRFTVELAPDAPWYEISDTVEVEGAARYASGAPVADAEVAVTIRRAEGRWPAPLSWEAPREAKTDRNGRFTVELGDVPPDLIERAVFHVSAAVTESAGEVARGGTQVILSRDDLRVESVTELGDGLVQGFNNRVYLRVSTPDGVPLPGTQLRVSNPWETSSTPREAETDEDGVAAIQIDPGDPVTVVLPTVPVRPRPLTPDAPVITYGNELIASRALSMVERKALDRLVPAIARCGDYTVASMAATVGLEVGPTGAVRVVEHGAGLVETCVGRAMRDVQLGGGGDRVYKITWQVPDSLRPSLSVRVQDAHGTRSGVETALRRAALRARPCLDRGVGVDSAPVLDIGWRVVPGSTSLVRFTTPATSSGLSASAQQCLLREVGAARLEKASTVAGMGTARLALSVPRAPGVAAPQAGTKTGYELEVVASSDAVEIGSTRALFDVGQIPEMRLRATPSLAAPGDSVKVEMFRGPSYTGVLPEKLSLMEGTHRVQEVEVSENAALFTLPEDVDGFLHVEYAGARTVVYVRSPDPLSVELTTDREVYRPGEEALLTVTTRTGGEPSPAGVGLVGVDDTLSQLAPLLGPDAYGRVTVRAKAFRPAFGAFDPQALTLGRVRGEQAAKAAVLRISQLPMDPAGDATVNVVGSVAPDMVGDLTQSFYAVLERLMTKVQAWEREAPEGEKMQPEKMAALWSDVLTEMDAEGTPATDGFGRPLSLRVLPPDLLEQVAPRRVVSDGVRLPEDVVSWTQFVAQEVK